MTETLAAQLKRLCCAETEGKFFDCVTDNIDTIIAALRRRDAVLKIINDKLAIIDNQRDALIEAERFMAYFANETDGRFIGPGTPTTCLEQLRRTLAVTRPDTSQNGNTP